MKKPSRAEMGPAERPSMSALAMISRSPSILYSRSITGAESANSPTAQGMPMNIAILIPIAETVCIVF